MGVRVYSLFSYDWSYQLDDTTTTNIALTERDASLLLQSVQYMLQRPAYIETLTDAQWDELEGRISDIIEELSTV